MRRRRQFYSVWHGINCRMLVIVTVLFLSAACASQAWKQDPDVQTARRECADLSQEEQYACIERHAVTNLDPDVCRLAGMWVDDMCLQAVYEAADDPIICDRLYLEGVRPNCRAYYTSLEAVATPLDTSLALTETCTDTTLGLALDYPAGWQVDAVADVFVRLYAPAPYTSTVGIVRYPQPAGATLDTVLDEVLRGGEGPRATHTQTLTVGGQPAVQVFFGPPEKSRPDTVILVADPTGAWWTIDGRGELAVFNQIVGTLRWMPRRPPAPPATPSPTTTATPQPVAFPTLPPTPTPTLRQVLTSSMDLHPPIGHVLWLRDDGLWLVDPDAPSLQRVGMAATAALWSPEGDRLAVLGPPFPGFEGPVGAEPFLIPMVLDLTANQRHAFPTIRLSPGSGLAWQTVAGRLDLYAIPAQDPTCLLRLDPESGEARREACPGSVSETRFAGDVVALPDGRLAHVVLYHASQPQAQGGWASLRLVDPATGKERVYPLFESENWQPGEAFASLHVPLALSPGGQHVAILVGPDVDPHDHLVAGRLPYPQGLYLLDVATGTLHKILTAKGLRWANWSPDGGQLAVGGQAEERPQLFIYDQTTDQVRSLRSYVLYLDGLVTVDGSWPEAMTTIPLAWNGDGRLLLGLHPQSRDLDVAHPRLSWLDPTTGQASLIDPHARVAAGWPTYALEDAGLTVRYPPGWAVREWPGDGHGLVGRSVAFAPPRYAESDRPQIPNISLAVFRPPLTDTLRAWLDVHSTGASFGSPAGSEVHFFGVSDVAAVEASGLSALRFTHDVFGMTAHELLLAIGETVVSLGYVDFGGEDLGLAFLKMRQGLAPAVVSSPPGLVYRTADGLWLAGDDGQQVPLFDRPDAVLSPDGTQALYVWQDDIWLADLSTGKRRNLTETPDRVERHPRWWPARPGVILFGSMPLDVEGPAWGFPTTIQTDGEDYRVLDRERLSFGAPAPSPDGQTIAYDGAGTAWLYRWSTGPEPFDPASYGLSSPKQLRIASPAWSPDGKRLAWVGGGTVEGVGQSGLAAFDLETRTAQFLHPHEPVGMGGWPNAPVWSPDGEWLVFYAYANDPVEAGSWLVRADGGEERFLGECGGPVWSPDGHWLALNHSEPPAKSVVWLVEVGTWRLQQLDLPPGAGAVGWVGVNTLSPTPWPTLLSPLTSGVRSLAVLDLSLALPGYERDFDWSPDGQALVFASEKSSSHSEDYHLWVAQAPDFVPRRLMTQDGHQPRWSPAGQQIAFVSRRLMDGRETETIWLVRADGSELRDLLPGEKAFQAVSGVKHIDRWLDERTLILAHHCGTGCRGLFTLDTITNETQDLPVGGAWYHWALSGDKYVAVEGGGIPQISLWETTDLGEWQKTSLPQPSEFYAWAPDSRAFLFGHWPWEAGQEPPYAVTSHVPMFYVWDVARGQAKSLFSGVYQGAWSPDGERIAFFLFGEPVFDEEQRLLGTDFVPGRPFSLSLAIWDVSSESVATDIPLQDRMGVADHVGVNLQSWFAARQPVWSPDGQQLVYWGESYARSDYWWLEAGGDIWIVERDGSEQQRLTHGLKVVKVVWSPDGSKLAFATAHQLYLIERP